MLQEQRIFFGPVYPVIRCIAVFIRYIALFDFQVFTRFRNLLYKRSIIWEHAGLDQTLISSGSTEISATTAR